MPIEVQIEKMHGKNLPVDKMQSLARAYALEQSKLQLADFKRLGVLGDWDNPYRTMKFKNEAEEIRALAAVVKKGYVYRGLKPVNASRKSSAAALKSPASTSSGRRRPGRFPPTRP